ncbi:hypothetical protein FACS189426_19710 [Bacteroidia bacterium]|nr:hypothetical protein FACS189426_19710 [Bacteroidia bacterium]
MQRRNFVKAVAALAAIPAVQAVASPLEQNAKSKKEIYEWRIYTLKDSGADFDAFLAGTLVPAYNRLGVTVGAFSLFRKEEVEKRHILFIYKDISAYLHVKHAIWEDKVFRSAAQVFYDATAPKPAYSNYEAYLCEAFDKIPVHRNPDKDRTLLEIRIYRSPNEEANQRKMRMFNSAEIDLFDKVGINSVAYGEVFAGPRNPAIMYLTWYKDEPTRAAAWKRFSDSDEWKRISKLPEYAYTATDNTSTFLEPLPYSQI